MSNDELQALVAQTIQIVNSNSRAIEANSTAIAELREENREFRETVRQSFEDTMTAIAAVAQVAQTTSESVNRLEQVFETWIRRNNNGNGSAQ